MFTGLVEETGTIRSIRRTGRSFQITISARHVLEGGRIGDSIAVNGVCLTVVALHSDAFTADVMPETYDRTNLKQSRVGSLVNLERTMALGDRFGGHIVQGHVDSTGEIVELKPEEIAVWVTVAAPPEVVRYVVTKGSIAIDGISLTVVDVADDRFRVSLIPHTFAVTAMARKKIGDRVNLEVDILAKYVERMLAGRGNVWPDEQNNAVSAHRGNVWPDEQNNAVSGHRGNGVSAHRGNGLSGGRGNGAPTQHGDGASGWKSPPRQGSRITEDFLRQNGFAD